MLKNNRIAWLAWRCCARTCARRALAVAVAALSIVTMPAEDAEAKPTGWQSPSELKGPKIDAWSGYGESGYIMRKAKSKRNTASSSKRKQAKLKQKSRKAGLKAAVKASGLAAESKKPVSIVKYAALDAGLPPAGPPPVSATGGGVRWLASASCLNGTLVAIIGQVSAAFGPVTVNSTCRSRKRNAAVGGARRSQHLTGNAVDFRVRGNVKAVHAFLRSNGSVGGFKHYGGGLFHIDTGPRRRW